MLNTALLRRQSGIQFESRESQIAFVLHNLTLRLSGKLAPPCHPMKCWTKTERNCIVCVFPRRMQLHVFPFSVSFANSDFPLCFTGRCCFSGHPMKQDHTGGVIGEHPSVPHFWGPIFLTDSFSMCPAITVFQFISKVLF